MNYQIIGLCQRSDITMSRWGFGIKLFPDFKKAVKNSGLTQEKVWTAVNNMGRYWLDGCGYSSMYEYDGKSEYSYKPNQDLRVSWGEWGPEHISVPGDACGLDICSGIGAPQDGKMLAPHNVDSMKQAMMLIMVFTWFAETIHNFADIR